MTSIPILTATEIDGMREAGRLTARCLREVGAMVAPGVTTKALDDAVRGFCERHNVTSATHGYRGFPAYCCTSVNHVVAHGIPSDRRLNSGSIVKIDIALRTKDGWHGDTCATFIAGTGNVKAQAVTTAARDALAEACFQIQAGVTTGDIGYFISRYARQCGFSVVREYGGHGIGQKFHDLPFVPNFGEKGTGEVLLPGMCITVEPMLNVGNRYIKALSDGSLVTRDRSWSAQFEHTLLITEDGCEILTQ